MAQNESAHLSLIRQSLDKHDLSSSAKEILMASWRQGTSKQYKTYLDRWQAYCNEHHLDVFKPRLNNSIEFLVSLYNSGLGYSAINTARSALSTILTFENGIKFGEHPLVRRYMKGIFELRPALPKYTEIWDVNIVLDYLKTFKEVTLLTLKELTLKLTMLLCLTTGQRGQTIYKIDVDGIQKLADGYRITIREKLKQTKPGKHLAPLELLEFREEKKLCVVTHLTEYLERTRVHRMEHSQLMLSYIKPFKPVSKDTIPRWVKLVLKSAGIDVQKYSAHSSRAASTSMCQAKGLNLEEILKTAGWSNAGTFAKFYAKVVDKASENFGATLLKT